MNRIHYLDAVRSFCMLFGVFVHANTFFDPRPFPLIPLASSYFRMETFFLISGFLLASVAHRTDRGLLIRRRLLALLLPFGVVLVLLNPVTNWLIYVRFNGWMPLADYLRSGWTLPAEGTGSWALHLWFLLSLAVYVVLHPALALLLRTRFAAAAAAFLLRRQADAMIALLGIGCAAAAVALRVAYEVALGPLIEGTRAEWIGLATVAHLPFFALGFLLEGHRDVFDRFHRLSLPVLAASLAGVILLGRWEAALPGQLAEAAAIAVDTVAIVGVIAGLLWAARRWLSGRNAAVATLTRSMYTVYLVHLFLIFALGPLVEPLLDRVSLQYLALALLTLGAGLLVHLLAVERSPVLTFLLNGRWPAARAAS